MKKFLFPGLLGLCLYFALAEGEYSLLDVKRAEAELVSRQTELPEIKAQIDSLTVRMKALESDDSALERLARERYGFIRDGEYLYRLSEADADTLEAGEPPR